MNDKREKSIRKMTNLHGKKFTTNVLRDYEVVKKATKLCEITYQPP